MKEPNQRKVEKSESEKLKERQGWMGLASACAAVVLAIVLILAFAGGEQPSTGVGGVENSAPPAGDVQQPVEEDLGMCLPIETVSVSNEFGFFYNQTLDCYYHHSGVDFAGAVGTKVLAVEDGIVESIYTGDLLNGTEIVLDHGDGMKTVYRFVTEAEGLAVGAEVKRGQVIATIAEASGNEYKEGAHLHFEMLQSGKSVDPSSSLPFEEK